MLLKDSLSSVVLGSDILASMILGLDVLSSSSIVLDTDVLGSGSVLLKKCKINNRIYNDLQNNQESFVQFLLFANHCCAFRMNSEKN